MADLRGKGKELHVDVKELIKGEMSESSFISKYGHGVCNIIIDSFKPQMSEIIALLHDSYDKAKEKSIEVDAKIHSFCAAFM